MQCSKERLQCHTVVFCQEFSPCGSVLVTGDNFGRIGVFALAELLAGSSSASAPGENCSTVTFSVCHGSIYALHTIDNYLVCGTTSGIKAFLWSSLVSAAESPAIGKPNVMWTLDPPSDIGGGRIVNALCTLGTHLVSASSSGCIHVWDVERERLTRKFDGHSKQALCVVSRPRTSEQCFSGSDDGTVKLWDSRSSACCHSITPTVPNPSLASSSSQSRNNNWVSAVAVDPNDRWLACGGSQPLTLHHIGMLTSDAASDSAPVSQLTSPTNRHSTPASIISTATTSSSSNSVCPQAVTYGTPASNGITNTCRFTDSSLLSAGSTSRLYHWDLAGSCQREVPCSSKILYSVAVHGEERERITSVAGSSAYLDVFTSYIYGTVKLLLS
ncbi:THO complex subunit 6 homolog [Sycon ciliatum]|uniref:THO complex subunit 6 homolog n=1 Tax=Sycon ciliatum TaxID=27933 RepID=UPI0031F7103B